MNTVRKLPLGRNITAALCTFLTTCLIIIYIQDIAFGAFTTMNALYQPRACLRIVLGIFTVAGEDVRRKGWRDLFRNEDTPSFWERNCIADSTLYLSLALVQTEWNTQ